MTSIPLLVINGDFYLQYDLGLVLVVVLYRLGLPSGFLSCYYTVWDCLLISFSEYYTSLELSSL